MSQLLTQTDDEPTAEQIAARVIELAREDHRDAKRDDSEIEIVDGVRVDPAPLTYKGASVNVDNEHTCLDDGEDVQVAIIQAYRDADQIDAFSTSTIYLEGYWTAALKDESRTGV